MPSEKGEGMSDCDPGYCQAESLRADYTALKAKADRLADAVEIIGGATISQYANLGDMAQSLITTANAALSDYREN